MKNLTLKEIAAQAGVSTATVSLVLNKKSGSLRISEKTREKVQKVIDELNFRPNPKARELRLQECTAVGMIVPDLINPFFARLVDSLELMLREMGRVLIIATSRDDLEKERQLIQELLHQGIGTLVICSCESKPPKINVPTIFIDRPHNKKKGLWISTHHRETTQKAMAIFFEACPKAELMFLGAHSSLSSSQERESAFIESYQQQHPKSKPTLLYTELHSSTCGAQLYTQWINALEENQQLAHHHLFFSSYALMEGFLMQSMKDAKPRWTAPSPLLCFDAPHQVQFFPHQLIYIQQDHQAMAKAIIGNIPTPRQQGIQWIPAVVDFHRPNPS